MASDPLKHVLAGEPLQIPAGAYNAFADAAQAHLDREHGDAVKGLFGQRPNGIVLVKNISGADCNRFDALGIFSVIFTPTDNLDEFKNHAAFEVAYQALWSHEGRFVVLLEPIPENQIGWACVNGVCPVQIDVSNEQHQYAEIHRDQVELVSRWFGSAQILWAESGTGTKWAVVRLGSPPAIHDVFPAVATGSYYTSGSLKYWYIDEIGTRAVSTSWPTWPSHTRDRDNNYISTICRPHWANISWPSYVTSPTYFNQLLVYPSGATLGGHHVCYAVDCRPPTLLAEITGIGAGNGSPPTYVVAKIVTDEGGGGHHEGLEFWAYMSGTAPGPAGGGGGPKYDWYPDPKVGGRIMVASSFGNASMSSPWYNYNRNWLDLTPRIPVLRKAWGDSGTKIARRLWNDLASDDIGRLWHLDEDT